jgi:hypothetical protein
MAAQVTVWQSNDGRYWPTENEAHKADLVAQIAMLFPGAANSITVAEKLVDRLKDIKPLIQASPYIP